MPGYNHGKVKTDCTYTNCVFASMYYVTITLVVCLEIAVMLRYFFLVDEEWATSTFCYVTLLTAVVIDAAVFCSLTRAKFEDPGYLIPPKSDKSGE